MNTETPFLPDALLAALREMPASEPTDLALKQRVQARLAMSLVGLAPVVTDQAVAAASDSVATNQVAAATAAVRRGLGGAKGIVVSWLAPVFVAGSIAGVMADRWYLRDHASRVVALRQYEAQSAASPAPQPAEAPDRHHEPSAMALSPRGMPAAMELRVASSAPHSTAEVSDPAPRAALAVPPASPTVGSAESSNSMAAERQLLDAARTALARGEPQAGIASLEKHIKRYPKGTLAEEREALYVRVLAASGNNNAAAARAANFERRFPNSIFIPVVRRAVSTNFR